LEEKRERSMVRVRRSLVVGALVAGLALSGASPAVAAEADPLAHLKEQFNTEPVAAFETAAKLSDKPKREKDLAWLRAVLAVTDEEPNRLKCHHVAEDMIDAVLPVAAAAGNWEALGGLYLARARLAGTTAGAMAIQGYLRSLHFLALAEEAYGKAGIDCRERIAKTWERLGKREIATERHAREHRERLDSYSPVLEPVMETIASRRRRTISAHFTRPIPVPLSRVRTGTRQALPPHTANCRANRRPPP